LGQASGWHILQSAFSFSFLYDSFNDLSGFCLLLGNYYAIVHLNAYLKNKSSKINLIIGLFPLFNVFFFQFISAPSPDVAVYVIAFIIFYLFIENYNNYSRYTLFTVALLSIFLAFIKLTAVIFCLFPIILFVKHRKNLKGKSTSIFIIGSLTLILFCLKNWILAGNVLYPFVSVESLSASWHLPKSIETYFFTEAKANGFLLSHKAYESSSFLTLLKYWLTLPKLYGFFNISMIAVLLIVPWFINRNTNKRSLMAIYFVATINLIILLLTSPQYRFFVPFLFFFITFIATSFLFKDKIVKICISLSVIVTAILVFYPTTATGLTDNNLHSSLSSFSYTYLFNPHSNSRYAKDYKTIKLGNTSINTPTNINFFWGTGNIPLPGVNEKQLDYFKTYFKVMPQQYSNNLKDGFYSKKLE